MIGESSAVRFGRIDFGRVNRAALANAVAVVRGLLPGGRLEGNEYVARNPLRPDRRLGSFKVNVATGRWADFATGDGGGDLVSLAAFVSGLPQRTAAIRLAEVMGVSPWA
ncbi:hypothetical protein [Novosphingobium mangrovi (ex Hu et al. 2023)]|uniref:Zinc finger CHC2-type domain-containing protein n=1 Tax=Novosphingobium mangrovi (ex Hu et al. 2023) TaxID=2930094 RepID=A0ABT0AFV6_9SPHN|nr:hypothetical protein [Novosphingobium mangrovi (ex Hu et al. 2023)]MCJ1962072.1 hypothetical protein [Novosphingobium mangrovi (ex Hu et al. 2023)]